MLHRFPRLLIQKAVATIPSGSRGDLSAVPFIVYDLCHCLGLDPPSDSISVSVCPPPSLSFSFSVILTVK